MHFCCTVFFLQFFKVSQNAWFFITTQFVIILVFIQIFKIVSNILEPWKKIELPRIPHSPRKIKIWSIAVLIFIPNPLQKVVLGIIRPIASLVKLLFLACFKVYIFKTRPYPWNSIYKLYRHGILCAVLKASWGDPSKFWRPSKMLFV